MGLDGIGLDWIGLDIGFIYHLYTSLRITRNYSAIADFHTTIVTTC
jgi:hypothetical protein